MPLVMLSNCLDCFHVMIYEYFKRAIILLCSTHSRINGEDLGSKINLSHPEAYAAVHSKELVLLLLMRCLLLLP